MAEYCATTKTTKKGVTWAGLGGINSLNMATLRELDDPLSIQINRGNFQAFRSRSDVSASRTESLVTEKTADAYRLCPCLGSHPLPGTDAVRRFRQVS